MISFTLKDHAIALGLVAGALAGVALVFAALVALVSFLKPTTYTAEPKFQVSQLVRLRLEPGIPAMVIEHYCRSLHPEKACRYRLRMTVPQDRTDVGLLGEDGPIIHQALSTLWVAEYEIEERY
jgi:hypothetical protein